jgi:hypothetical protein
MQFPYLPLLRSPAQPFKVQKGAGPDEPAPFICLRADATLGD